MACRSAALAILLAVAVSPGVTGAPAAVAPAQADGWLEATTDHFVIVYRPGSEPQRDYYRQHIEALYADLARLFGLDLPPPLTLRLYPTLEDYLEANPLAAEVEGVVAQAHRGRREVGIALDRALAEGDEGLAVAARYELAHLFIYRLSEGRLPAGFQEGVARYLAGAPASQPSGVARLREAWSRGALLAWSELAAPGAAYLNPPLGYPEALSVVHYLVAEFHLAAVVDFVRASATAPGWRSALQLAFGRSPEQLEAGWRDWLPGYLDGGWRFHALYAQDLTGAEELLQAGNYQAVVAELSASLSFLEEEDPRQAERARTLLQQAQAAARARGQLWQARGQLLAGDYAAALASAQAASGVLEQVGDRDAVAAAAAIRERARLGLDAEASLRQAAGLPPWRMAQARLLADRAAVGFARLGNDVAAAQAQQLRLALDRRQAPVGWALLGLGGALLAWNLTRRWRDPREAA